MVSSPGYVTHINRGLDHTQIVKGEYCNVVKDHCIDHKTFESNKLAFCIVNFPYICSNIPESQLIRYAIGCSSYGDFIDRGRILTNKLVDQG